MFIKNAKPRDDRNIYRSLFISLGLFGLIILGFIATGAQTPSPSPAVSSTPEKTYGGYRVTGALEAGWRWRSLSGNVNKYRSDLNYKEGFRSFDSNFLLQTEEGKGKYFDSLLFSNSGWGSDPTGSTRVNIEKTGAYKFTSSVRKVTYFNNLFNFANPVRFPDSEHSQNTRHTFGDFDFTGMPQSRTLRLTFGVSFNDINGTGGTTERFFSDEFAVKTKLRNSSMDYRIGAEGTALGFDWGISQGIRNYRDRPFNFLDGPSQGNTTTNQSRLDTLNRSYPMDGRSYYTQFNLHRLIAEKLDFTGRLIYTSTRSSSSMLQQMTGRDNTNPVGILVTSDNIDVVGHAKRPQTRGDIGLTYAVTSKFRISNTFTFDQFAINTDNIFSEVWTKASGAERRRVTNSSNYRRNAYRRYMDLIEGDYQFNPRYALHLGYRYTNRKTHNNILDVSCTTTTTNTSCPPAPPTINIEEESEHNSTNSVIAGMKMKPLHNWVIFWDVEHGKADNVFTRPENYRYTNFRVRSRVTVDKFTLNLSAITKNNENPSQPSPDVILPPGLDFTTVSKNRFYSGSVDWEPNSMFWFSGGYTYRTLDSHTPVALPFAGVPAPGYVYGTSQFFMRDHYLFLDVSAKPVKRVSFYASYRLDLDHGQGDRISSPITIANPNFVTSYPMQFTTPEIRVAVRINHNIDWNVGAQYYNYHDTQTPFLNYKAFLPYTSLRLYFGGRAIDR